jgi:hypothetical protein
MRTRHDRVVDERPLMRPARTTVLAATQTMGTQRVGALRRMAALATLSLVAAQWLTGCGMLQSRSMIKDPIGESAAAIAPGTPRHAVHSRLGLPFYSSEPWRAEVYAGDAVMRVWWRDMVVPVPAFKEKETATLLVVYGPDDVVSGTAYSGPGCGSACAPQGAWGSPFACKPGTGPCVSGDLQGLDVTAHQVLLAPAAASADLASAPPAAGRCSLLIDAGIRVPALFDVYLDGRFLQRVPVNQAPGFLRVEVDPGDHTLACTVPFIYGHKGTTPRPGHGLSDRSLRSAGSRLTLSCGAGERIYVQLVNTGGKGVLRGPACGVTAIDADAFAARPAGSRMVIVPGPTP